MTKISRKKIRLDTEKTIIIALVTSTKFCAKIVPQLNIDYFKTKPIRVIVQWIVEYYHLYDSAPGEDIEEIFKEKVEDLESEDADLIRGILQHLSERHELNKTFNINYLLKKTNKYFNRRALELTQERLSFALEKGNIRLAEKTLIEHKKVAEESFTVGVRPNSDEMLNTMLRDVYNIQDDSPNILFSLSGRLGTFTGHLKRGWLIGFMGPMKRGKSYWLVFLMFEAILNKRKVIFFSLEMNAEEVYERFNSLVTGGFLLKNKIFLLPIFDCRLNQQDKCNKPQRTGNGEIQRDEDDEPQDVFKNNKSWVTCTECRGTGNFKVSIWFKRHKKKKTTIVQSRKHINAFNELYADYFRVISYPAFSANIEQLMSDIDNLEYTEGFIPDVIIIDYADILAPEKNTYHSERGPIDVTWKTLKRLAGVKNCLVATASQSNRSSINKRVVEQIDTAEDIRKLAHVVAMYGLNQTDEEKDAGYMRVNIIAHRFKKFTQERCVYIIQNVDQGQTVIDSEF